MNTANHVIGVSYATVRDGLVDDPVTGSVFLVDDGTNGDQVANDGIFTSNNVTVGYNTPPGPRTLRLFAQVLDTAGIRHATLIDMAPFFVLSQKPTGPPPRLSGFNTPSGRAGSQMTINGSGFDPQPGNNQVIVGSRLARVMSASPAQLVILIPPDSPAGPATVVVASQGQTSNAIPFTVK